jgi:hypothetical protein
VGRGQTARNNIGGEKDRDRDVDPDVALAPAQDRPGDEEQDDGEVDDKHGTLEAHGHERLAMIEQAQHAADAIETGRRRVAGIGH